MSAALTRTMSATDPSLEAGSIPETRATSTERRRGTNADEHSMNGNASRPSLRTVRGRSTRHAKQPIEEEERLLLPKSPRPGMFTSKSYNGPLGGEALPSPTRLEHGGGSFSASRGRAPALNITIGNTGLRARQGPLTPLRPSTPSTGLLYPPAVAASTTITRRMFRGKTTLLGVTIFTIVCSLYFTTFHPEASGALLKTATAPLENAANAAKAAIAGTSPAEATGASWSHLLGFGGDLMDIHEWGDLNSGRDSEGLLPLSPWNRYREIWNKRPEDTLLRQVNENRPDGRVLIEEGKPHPIPLLMDRAKQRWRELNNRQSKTFGEAVEEYQRRHGRRPPRGFDRWYAFARAHGVKLIDEFDLIEHSLRPFRAFPGPSFRRRASKAASIDNTWRIRVSHGEMYREGELGHHDRAKGILDLCQNFKDELPDMIIGYNGHDGARVNIGWEERMRLEDMTENGLKEEYNPKDVQLAPVMESPPPGWGIPQSCEVGSAMRENDFVFGDPDLHTTGLEVPQKPAASIGSFIGSVKQYLDVCNSPQYRHYHASTSWSYQTWPTTVMPLFTPGVHARFGDIYCIIDEQFRNEASEGLAWHQRSKDMAVWRGQASGPFYEGSTPWWSTQRPRLHLMSHQKKGNREVVVAERDGTAHRKVVKNSLVNPLFFDTGIVGPAVQCLEEDGTCDRMSQTFDGFDERLTYEDQEDYKYQLDIDGNSWSGRFRRLMLSNGVVLKATIFPEFWTDWAIPWIHYIPVQVDYSDIHDIMAFFRGGSKGEGSHDHLAREIAAAGKEWAKAHMRWQDIEAYTFRLLLEYGRLYNTDREDMDFVLEVADYEPVWYPM